MSTISSTFIPSIWADKIGQMMKDADILRNLFSVSWAERVPNDEEDVASPTFLAMQACMFGDLT